MPKHAPEHYRLMAARSAAVRSRNAARRRADKAAAKIAAYIERTLAAAPPLTDEQRVRLAELLRPARHTAANAAADRVA